MALATLTSKKELPKQFEKLYIITIENTTYTIGRSLETSVSIPFIGLSRKHCTFKRYPSGTWTINDHSTFGITLNDNILPKNADYPMKDGDTIKLDSGGNFIYTFNYIESPSTSNVSNGEPNSRIHPTLFCSICNELFNKACIIKCGHTYCTHCINEWKKKSKTCPLCRSRITNITSNVVIDELVEQCIENLDSEERLQRQIAIEEREKNSQLISKRKLEESNNAIITRRQSK